MILCALLAVGCKREVFLENVDNRYSLVVSTRETSRTELAPADASHHRALLWSKGDSIVVSGIVSKPLTEEAAGKGSAEFSFRQPLQPPLEVLYPANDYVDENTLNLPAVQGFYEGDGIASGFLPMIGYSEGMSPVELHHICSAVKISVLQSTATQGDPHRLAYVSLRGGNGERLCGNFRVDWHNHSVSPTEGTDGRSVKVICTGEPSSELLSAIVVVPAGVYEKGFSVTVVDEYGHAMTKTRENAITLTPGEIAVMPPLEFVPTDTVVDVEISSAAQLVQFAADYNEGKPQAQAGAFLTGTLTFTPQLSEAFAKTGGIGTPQHPFTGRLEGRECVIKKFAAKVPLVAVASSQSCITGITVDSSCSFEADGSSKDVAYIVGRGLGVVSGCSCTAPIKATLQVDDSLFVGGIVARQEGGRIADCRNSGAVNLIIQGNALCSKPTYVGGIAGLMCCDASVLTNTGTITVQPKTVYQDLAAGGIAGAVVQAGKAIQVNLSELENKARIYLNASLGIKDESSDHLEKNSNFNVGGIAGKCIADVAVSQCSNSGEVNVTHKSGTKINQRPSSVGGIFGRLHSGNATLEECTVTSNVVNSNFCNTYVLNQGSFMGGITGVAVGADGGRIAVTNCSYAGSGKLTLLRGIQGGIVGYACNTDISRCSMEAGCTTPSSNIPRYQGGIAGWTERVTVSECTVSGRDLTNKTTASTHCGGIVGYAMAMTDVLDCEAKNNKFTRNASGGLVCGGIVGCSESEYNEISGNTFSASYSLDGGKTYSPLLSKDIVGEGKYLVKRANTNIDEYITIKGTVRDDGGKPVGGAIVSDGLHCILSADDGSFEFPSCKREDVSLVTVTNPEGYVAPVVNGLPQFHKILGRESHKDGVYDLEFIFNKAKGNPDRFSIVISADLQPRASTAGFDNFAYHSLDCCEDIYRSWRELEEKITDRPLYGITLGDIVHENMTLYENYLRAIAKNHFPTYNILGNHDYDLDTEGSTGGSYKIGYPTFEKKLNPVNCSFTLGKWHVIAINDMILGTDGDGRHPKGSYSLGFDDRTYEWLCNDLALVSFDTPVMFCAHAPCMMTFTYDCIDGSGRHVRDVANLLAKYAKVHGWFGHWHNTFNYIYPSTSPYHNMEVHMLARSTGDLWTNEWQADGTPRGYTLVDVDGTDVSWQFQPTPYQSSEWCSELYKSPQFPLRYYSFDNEGVAQASYGKLDSRSQMTVYPPDTYEKDYIYANVYLWDSGWEMPVFTPQGGSAQQMESAPVFTWDFYNKQMKDYYKTNQPKLADQSFTYLSTCKTIFRVQVSSDTKSGTVSVKDRFGKTYTSTISW